MDIDDILSDLDSSGEEGNDVKEVQEATVVEQSVEKDNDTPTSDDLTLADEITTHSSLKDKVRPMLQQIEEFSAQRIDKKTECDFLVSANDTSLEITNEQTQIHDFIKEKYSKRFPELESIIPLPLDFAKVIIVLQNSLDVDPEKLSFIGKEKILVLTISALQAKERSVTLTDQELDSIVRACNLVLQLNDFKLRIEEYLSSRLAVFAPNLTAIVGPHTAAEFMSITGGLTELAKTPACNVAALGNKRVVAIGSGQHGIRQQGFLYHSELVQNVIPDLRKQAMRITAGKVILAARIDFSASIPDGSQGKKWRQEILEKIEMLEEPPDVVATKALPVPVDRKANKRGGRRYRKLKQKFEMSDLRKAQDRVVFGQQEKTITDAFGDQVGLGMLSSLQRLPQNANNKAKMSKSMKSRLQSTQQSELFNQDMISLPVRQIAEPPQKKLKR